jgi:hypothetical protein
MLILAFAFFWTIGLVSDLQRTETLSLSKFLHLPVSLKGAFLINYLSSLLGLSLLVFGPVMLGFSLALVFARGIRLLCAPLLLAALLLMVTGLTYQFQGWLASLMSNPRRRRTIVVGVSLVFVLIAQLPALLNMTGAFGPERRARQSTKLVEELAELGRRFEAREIDAIEHLRRQQEVIRANELAAKQAERESDEDWERNTRLLNLVLPIGWLPLGVMSAAEGNIVPAILGFLGMTSIGAASLWRAYRTTVRLYQGGFTAGQGPPVPAVAVAAAPARGRKARDLLVETRLPGLSEPVSVIALGGFRSLVRSPEAKMMLLTPALLALFFGSTLMKGGNLPTAFRPLVAFGALACVLFSLTHFMCNQFGFDREGFRVFVLCSVPRRQILLGKNLAIAPLAVGLAVVLLTAVEVFCPPRLDHFLAAIPQFVSMFFAYCLLANLVSIYAPIHISPGTMKPSNLSIGPALLQMVAMLFFFPLTQAVTLLPLGIEVLLEHLGWTSGAPICLVLSLAECAAVVAIYRIVLDWEGNLFQAREQKILETVTAKAP